MHAVPAIPDVYARTSPSLANVFFKLSILAPGGASRGRNRLPANDRPFDGVVRHVPVIDGAALARSRLRRALTAPLRRERPPSPGNSARTETNMSSITLYTNDETTATGIREATFEEILAAAR